MNDAMVRREPPSTADPHCSPEGHCNDKTRALVHRRAVRPCRINRRSEPSSWFGGQDRSRQGNGDNAHCVRSGRLLLVQVLAPVLPQVPGPQVPTLRARCFRGTPRFPGDRLHAAALKANHKSTADGPAAADGAHRYRILVHPCSICRIMILNRGHGSVQASGSARARGRLM